MLCGVTMGLVPVLLARAVCHIYGVSSYWTSLCGAAAVAIGTAVECPPNRVDYYAIIGDAVGTWDIILHYVGTIVTTLGWCGAVGAATGALVDLSCAARESQ
jgi:hypothetical protein